MSYKDRVSIPPGKEVKCARFNKLEQLRTKETDNRTQIPSSSYRNFENRQRTKAVSTAVAMSLLSVPDTPMKKAYVRSLYCNHYLIQDGSKVTSHYCGDRWCQNCNRIRTANLINGYEDAIKTMSDPYFVTLTRIAIPTDNLWYELPKVFKTWRQVMDVRRKRHKRGKDPLYHWQGIRKFEANYNPDKDTFNPHFHIIVDGKDQAKALRDVWTDKAPCIRSAQHIRKADKESLNELFKYFTKVFTNERLYPVAMDKLFQAMKGKRTVQPFGGLKKVSTKVPSEETTHIDFKPPQIEVYAWMQEQRDWVDPSGGDLFIGSTIPDKQERLIQRIELDTR